MKIIFDIIIELFNDNTRSYNSITNYSNIFFIFYSQDKELCFFF